MFKKIREFIGVNKFFILFSLSLSVFSVVYFFYSMKTGQFLTLRSNESLEWIMRGVRVFFYICLWFISRNITPSKRKINIRKLILGGGCFYEFIIVFNLPLYLIGILL